MALAAQVLEAKKAWKAFETCEALEQVAARMKRVMGLTFDMSCGLQAAKPAGRRPLDGTVRLRATSPSSFPALFVCAHGRTRTPLLAGRTLSIFELPLSVSP